MTDILAEHVEGSASDCGGEAPGQVGKGTPRLGKGSLTSQTKATLEFILALSGIPDQMLTNTFEKEVKENKGRCQKKKTVFFRTLS